MMKKTGLQTQRFTRLGLLAALGVLLTLFRFSPFPVVNFLEFETSDLPILLGTLLYGVPAGLSLTLIVSVLQGLLVSPQSGVYGVIMHCIATGALVAIAGSLFRLFRCGGLAKAEGSPYRPGNAALAVSLCGGVAAMCVSMFAANLVVTPLFTGWPRAAVMDVMPWILLFNLEKAGINSALCFVVYKLTARAFGADVSQ